MMMSTFYCIDNVFREMHPGEAPHFVSEFKPFQKSTLDCLENQPVAAFSGVSRGRLLAAGPDSYINMP